MKRIVLSSLVLTLSLSSLFAQQKDNPTVPVADSTEPAPVEKTPGFYAGTVYFSFSGGIPFSEGSLIDQEKAYNRSMFARATINNLSVRFFNYNLPGLVLPFRYKSEGGGSADFEYAFAEHFGAGISYSHFQIVGFQPESFPDFPAGATALSAARESIILTQLPYNLYNGNTYLLHLSYHPISANRIDPYLSLRAGFVDFETFAHPNLNFDPFRFFSPQARGYGTAVGGALGTNIHWTQEIGFKLEVSYTREYLKSDLFSTRSLNLFRFGFGIIFNMNEIAEVISSPSVRRIR